MVLMQGYLANIIVNNLQRNKKNSRFVLWKIKKHLTEG